MLILIGRPQNAGEGVAGELTALIRIEDLWLAKAGEHLLQRRDTEAGVHRVRQPPGQTLRLAQSMMATRYSLGRDELNTLSRFPAPPHFVAAQAAGA